MLIRALSLSLALALAACGGPLSTPLPDDVESWSTDPALKSAIESLPPDDKQILMGFAARRILSKSLGGPSGPMPATLGDAIKDQRDFLAERERQQAEAEALAAQQRAEAEAKYARLREAVTVGLVSKTFVEANWRKGIHRDQIALTFVFQNNTDRDIAGVKGTVVTQNMFGDTIKLITFAYDGGIPANSRASWDGALEYNQFRDEDRNLANTPLDKIKVVWQPDTILFTDGGNL